MAQRLRIIIFEIALFFFLRHATSAELGNETDRLSLLAFKAGITDDPLGLMDSWNQSTHFCQWPGVGCSSRHQRVTVLDLSSSRLGGLLSPHIGNLSFLKVLDLGNNSFFKTVPQELGFLRRLQKLWLTNNTFSGEIPANLSRCLNLQVLHLGGNSLKGKLPTELGLLSNLEAFSFYKNNITCELPSSLGNLTSLQSISGAGNRLSGAIPDSFGQLKKLTFLAFGLNHLSGPIPSSLYNASSLVVFSVPFNQLEGFLPSDLGVLLPNIETFSVSFNHLRGIIPPAISNATKLSSFAVSANNLYGDVPSLVGLSNLEVLLVDFNNHGYGQDDDLNFLSHLVNCSILKDLAISDNNFGGSLPGYIGNFSTNFRHMVFGRNQIHGTIPAGIGNLIGLDRLGLESNHLSGTIPSSLGRLPELGYLFLNGNELSGTIPSSLGNLTNVQRVNLELNNLHGNIPASLGNWRMVDYLSLSHNRLSGSIPREVMSLSTLTIEFHLSDNLLSGSIPAEVRKLVNLGTLNLSNNRLWGEIPGTLGSCISLESLSLQGNLLQGPIPETLISLKALQTLDLSCNNLSGKIPDFLASFKLLQNLNLSLNDFSGEVPQHGVFHNASVVSLIGNRKLCSTLPQLRLPRCTSSKSKQKKSQAKSRTIIIVTSGLIFLGLVLILLCFLLYYRSRKGRRRATSASSLGFSHPKISYRDLLRATNGFSSENLLGMGSFGSVYKGVLLRDQIETIVAVKVLNLQQTGALKSFMAECEALRSIKHRNLVEILTVCSSTDFSGNEFKALVYEFMVNRSIEEWLHPSEDQHRHLNFIQRLNIANDVANALDYLHNRSLQPIVHRDLKPSNVLLDSDMTACIGDFGLARFIPEDSFEIPASSTGFKGSIGYVAPECAMGSVASPDGDVYSFGILLLEMFTGKRPTDELFKDNFNLREYVAMALPYQVLEILDPTSVTEQSEVDRSGGKKDITNPDIMECVMSVLRTGVSCSAPSPSDRMNIGVVASRLHRIRESVLGSRI